MNRLPFGKSWLLLSLVAIAQIAVLANIVIARQNHINNGHEVVLNVIPVDPRDLFRGDYVILGYDITNIDAGVLKSGDDVMALNSGDTIYVALARGADGVSKPIALAASMQDAAMQASANSDTAVIRGTISYRNTVTDTSRPGQPSAPAPQFNVHYGIESYFVPEGTGRELEAKVRTANVRALVALDKGGVAALKGLEVDGERLLMPPLF